MHERLLISSMSLQNQHTSIRQVRMPAENWFGVGEKDSRSIRKHNRHTLRITPQQIRGHNERKVRRRHLRNLRYPLVEEYLEERDDEEDDAAIDRR